MYFYSQHKTMEVFLGIEKMSMQRYTLSFKIYVSLTLLESEENAVLSQSLFQLSP